MLSFVVTKVTNDFASRIGFYLRARVLVLKLFIPRLSLLVMAEIGRNCAVSAFCFWVGGVG
ncbi:hypothetical protein NEIPOLOT_02535 [Neisseria polysaccharea ATCC 43768]|nr:hypothetical protein NEIPOLOT_02535 [Neisseria polysaccharea ATCC 43768]